MAAYHRIKCTEWPSSVANEWISIRTSYHENFFKRFNANNATESLRKKSLEI